MAAEKAPDEVARMDETTMAAEKAVNDAKLIAIGNGIKSMRWLGRKPEERTWDDWHFMSIIASHDGTYQIERFEFDVLQSRWTKQEQRESIRIVNENKTKDNKDDQTKYKDYDVLRQELKDVPDKYEKYKKYKEEYELLTKDKATLIAMIKLIEFHNEKDSAEQIAIQEKEKLGRDYYDEDGEKQRVFEEYQANVTKATEKYQDVNSSLNDTNILELIKIIKDYENKKNETEQQEIAALYTKLKNDLEAYSIKKQERIKKKGFVYDEDREASINDSYKKKKKKEKHIISGKKLDLSRLCTKF